jgi:hypothetical protein
MREKESLVEAESLKDLEKIIRKSEEWNSNFVVIGGYAVRAYTKGYRYTKYIDLAAPRCEKGKLTALLKGSGYKVEETEFGLKGRKKIDGGFIDFHISIGEIWDISTNIRYPVDELGKSEFREISGYFEEGRKMKIRAPVVSLEDLIILKLITRGRERDLVDAISLITDRWGDLDLKRLASKCLKTSLNKHMRKQVLTLIGATRTGEARKMWLSVTGQRLMRKTEMELIKKLKGIYKELQASFF